MMKKNFKIGKYLIIFIYAFLAYYIMLPAINLKNPEFYGYLFSVGFFSFIINLSFSLDLKKANFDFKPKTKVLKYLSIFGLLFIGSILVINLINTPIFNSKAYARRIEVKKDKTFTEDVKQVNFKALPLLDKDSSQKLGDRVMGQLPELVSQFTVSNLYTQINYNDEILRVTPLEYASWIKYFTNNKEGVKGYITVNSVSGEANLTKLDKGMKIMPSALFGNDLKRYVRFKYPTLIFGDFSFEIDNSGKPYWIIPIVDYVGVGLRKNIVGIIEVDPVNGETKKYETKDVPAWIDHVYSADLIIDQFDDYGRYQNGWWNSLFGQKGVVQTTDGYNYTVMNDDVYLYTGVTSISSDEANLGFILTNLRTKETNFYPVPGAEEYSAMASAEGQVQQMKYTSSFPLLINLNNRPTYLISLKDNAGLVKMYAFVDVVDYQKVVVSDASLGIEKSADRFLNSFIPSEDKTEKNTLTITISNIKTGVVEGNTYYYLLDKNNKKYRASLKLGEGILPFLKADDKLQIVIRSQSDLTEIVEIIHEK